MTDMREEYERVLKKARAVQAKQVMPLIGPLLDAWEEVPNDVKSGLREDCPMLCGYLDTIETAMGVDINDAKGASTNNG